MAAARLTSRATALGKRFAGLLNDGAEFAKPKAITFWNYAKVEMKPPLPNEIPQIAQSLTNIAKSAQTGAWKKLTVKEVWLNTLVATEVGCFFFIGECIGKGSLIGYEIPGAVHYETDF